jgi:hypothetical protein
VLEAYVEPDRSREELRVLLEERLDARDPGLHGEEAA